MKTEDFFLINRGWNKKIRVFFGTTLNELTERQFKALPNDTTFNFEGRGYRVSSGRIVS
jgi:hypothetical protein